MKRQKNLVRKNIAPDHNDPESGNAMSVDDQTALEMHGDELADNKCIAGRGMESALFLEGFPIRQALC